MQIQVNPWARETSCLKKKESGQHLKDGRKAAHVCTHLLSHKDTPKALLLFLLSLLSIVV